MVVQWLGIHASIAAGTGSIFSPGTKIPHAMWCGKNEKRKRGIVHRLKNKIKPFEFNRRESFVERISKWGMHPPWDTSIH